MDEELSRESILAGLHQFPYWRYCFDLGHGIFTRPPSPWDKHRLRLNHIFTPLLELCGGSFKGLTVLDIGCSGGFWSIEARKHGADYVLGIDPGHYWIEQAKFVSQVLHVDNIEFRQMSVSDLSKEAVGTFDICLFLGVLYHLMSPVDALEKIRKVSKKYVVVDTFSLPVRAPLLEIASRPYMPVGMYNTAHVMIPSRGAVEYMLEYTGFRNVRQIPARRKIAPYRLGIRGTWIGEVPPSFHDMPDSADISSDKPKEFDFEFNALQLGSISVRIFFTFKLLRLLFKLAFFYYESRVGKSWL